MKANEKSYARVSLENCPIRDSHPVPPFLQRAVTSIDGRPHSGQRRWPVTPARHLWTAILSWAGGIVGAAGAAIAGGPALILLYPSWIAYLHGARKLAMTVMHQCAHDSFFWNDRRLNELLGECVTVMLVGQNFSAYREEHIKRHHSKHHMTSTDPTVEAQHHELGMLPGCSEKENYRKLLAAVTSPTSHVKQLARRWRSYWSGASLRHRVLAAAYLTVIGSAFLYAPKVIALAVIIPLTLLYNITLQLRLCTEHVYPPKGTTSSADVIAYSTHAIRFAPRWAIPQGASRARRLLWQLMWHAEFWLYHVPCKLVFAPGEGAHHDYHHRRVRDRRWAEYVFERDGYAKVWHQRNAATGRETRPYTEVWGIHGAIAENIRTLSLCDPAEYGSREEGEDK